MKNEKLDMDIVNNFFKHDYHDRGLKKWQGFFLSDHTVALHNEFNNVKITPKEKQTVELISKRLKIGWEYNKPVTLQLDLVNNDYEITELKGIVEGFNANIIILKDDKNELVKIELEQIRNCFFQ